MNTKGQDDLYKKLLPVTIVLVVAAAVCVVFAVRIHKKANREDVTAESIASVTTVFSPVSQPDSYTFANHSEAAESSTVTAQAETTLLGETTTAAQNTTTASTTQPQQSGSAQLIDFPSDEASWSMILLNKKYRVKSDADKSIDLSYVAGSGELMDSRAASWYEKMYDAAAEDGIYLTPCSGYRSYDEQYDLYYEFVYDYVDEGYSMEEAEELASRRRMPPGSSEHNIGICMDIICADSSVGFENTEAYAWLSSHASDYGFILRYPADKQDITGVKFEPWHWRYVGVANAASIKNSGLCLEEYLGR